MQSCNEFKKTSLVEIKDLNFVVDQNRFFASSARDYFVNWAKAPFRSFIERPDRKIILDHINLSASSGDRIGILGVNGAGKTTLCRCIAGIYSTKAVQRYGSVRSIFDSSIALHADLTGRENAKLMAKLMYTEKSDLQTRLEEALQFSELRTDLDTPFRTYSTGMQTRLCLSIVSMYPADILILDEVFDGADIFFRNKIAERISKLVQESGCVFFISHQFEQIRQLCNRVIVLHKGQIAFDGSVEKGIKFYLDSHLRIEGSSYGQDIQV